jgi:hypothetical protein
MRRAFLWGVNNYPTAPLQGCVNDVNDMAEHMRVNLGWQPEEIRILTDERATKDAVIQRLAWLVYGLQPGDVVLYHESRHGAKVAARNEAGEVDKLDEVAVPYDFDWTPETYIIDDSLLGFMAAVPDGATLLWVSDSCYSGGLSRLMPALSRLRTPRAMPLTADMRWRVATAESKGLKTTRESANYGDALRNVLLLAACTEDQEASDAFFGFRWNGALTWHLLRLLKTDMADAPMYEVAKVLAEKLLYDGFEQVPMLIGNEAMKQRPFLS